MLFMFDASSIIHFVDNYPMQNPHLSELWDWFAKNIEAKKFIISKIAYDEVLKKTDISFHKWFENIEKIQDSIEDLSTAMMIKELLHIEEEDYGAGVGENDIFIISIAKRKSAILVSEESIQTKLPPNKKKYKIPAVCNINQVGVECINFTELLVRNP